MDGFPTFWSLIIIIIAYCYHLCLQNIVAVHPYSSRPQTVLKKQWNRAFHHHHHHHHQRPVWHEQRIGDVLGENCGCEAVIVLVSSRNHLLHCWELLDHLRKNIIKIIFQPIAIIIMMTWTGPKISSLQIFIPSVTSLKTVGSTKYPRSPNFPPPFNEWVEKW